MNNKEKSNYLTEGIAIAGFTLFSYIIAFQYESGFCSHWKIPEYFIDISLTTVVAAGLSLFFFVSWVFIIINIPISLLDKELSKEDSFRKRVVIYHIGLLSILFALFLGYGISLIPIYLLLVFLLLDCVMLLLPWYLDKRKHPEKTNFFERITRSNESIVEPKDGFAWFRLLMGAKIYWLLLCIIPIVTIIASAAGTAAARRSQTYLVVESEGLILIKRYGGTYILRPIDLRNNKVGGEILIWQSEDIAKHKLTPKFLKKIKITES